MLGAAKLWQNALLRRRGCASLRPPAPRRGRSAPLALSERRALLRRHLKRAGAAILYSEHLDGADGEAMFRHACALSLKGIISKRLDNPYVSGRCASSVCPADAIKRLLSEKPGAKGLAVPGMPVGSPRMEAEGSAPETYDVVLFGNGKPKIFARYRGRDAI